MWFTDLETKCHIHSTKCQIHPASFLPPDSELVELGPHFGQEVRAAVPHQMLAYNLSPSFNWDSWGLDPEWGLEFWFFSPVCRVRREAGPSMDLVTCFGRSLGPYPFMSSLLKGISLSCH